MQARGVNHFLIFIWCFGLRRLALRLGGPQCVSTARPRIALATSPLFLVPGVPLINGGHRHRGRHVLIGVSRLVNAMLLIVCIAVGLSATLLMIKDSLLAIFTDILFDALSLPWQPSDSVRSPILRCALFPRIALLAAVGHALRFALMRHAGLDIASASFVAAFAIGMGSSWLGRGVRCPHDGALLHPGAAAHGAAGIYAYKTVFFAHHHVPPVARPGRRRGGALRMQQFFLNATVFAERHLALLAVSGAHFSYLYQRQTPRPAFSMTRRKRVQTIRRLLWKFFLLEHDCGSIITPRHGSPHCTASFHGLGGRSCSCFFATICVRRPPCGSP